MQIGGTAQDSRSKLELTLVETVVEQAANPFATSRIRPGAIAFRFSDGQSLPALVDSLAAHDWKGAIVGPHGTGKSSLLTELLPLCEATRPDIRCFQLRDGQRSLPSDPQDSQVWTRATLVVVDGYEQLSLWSRWRLLRQCRRTGAGLLVTSHRPVSLPTLLQTRSQLELLRELVAELLREWPESCWPTDAEVAESFHRAGGNLREALLLLYDLYQQKERRDR